MATLGDTSGTAGNDRGGDAGEHQHVRKVAPVSLGVAHPGEGRTSSRRNAMMVLYKLDLMGSDVDAAVTDFTSEHGFELPAYARELVEGVSRDRDLLDTELQRFLVDWTVDRLGAVERAVLRIALFELDAESVPHSVVIDEAVDLAKRYASPEAAKLVNGVLGGRVRMED